MSKNKSVEDVLKDYNGYDFCGEKACSGQNKANELLTQLYELLVSEAEPISDTEDAVTVSAINRLFGKTTNGDNTE